MNDRRTMFDVAGRADDRPFAIGNDFPRQRGRCLLHQPLTELRAEWNEDCEIVGNDPAERIGDHRTGGYAGHRRDGRRASFEVDCVLDDNKPADIHDHAPIIRSKFWLKIAEACSAGNARRTKFTGSASPRGNGASLPIIKCSTGTTVAAYSRIFGSKQTVSK